MLANEGQRLREKSERQAAGEDVSDDEDEEDFVNEGRSDTDEEMDEPEDVEDWVDEDGDLGPEDGEVNEDDGYDDRYAPL